MKSLIILALSVGLAIAGVVPVANVVPTGKSHLYRSDDGFGNSAFGYEEAHSEGASTRSEQRTADGKVVGSYSLVDADGRQRVVKYVADEFGFRVALDSNEPGVAAQSPAAVNIGSDKIPDPVIPVEETVVGSKLIKTVAGAHYVPHHSVPVVHAPLVHKQIVY